MNNTNEQLVFSWIKFSDLSNLKNPFNPSIRKDSPLSRIFKKIKSNLESELKELKKEFIIEFIQKKMIQVQI